jgi:hypothetical protein
MGDSCLNLTIAIMEIKSPRHPSVLLVALTAGAGVASGLAAATGSGPFAGLAAQPSSLGLASQHGLAGPPAAPVNIGALFPPPRAPIVHRRVDIYDLPPAAPTPPAVAPQPVAPQESAGHHAPALTSTPSHNGAGDDKGGGDDGHGGGGGGD